MNRIDHRRLHWVLAGVGVLSLAAVTLQGFGISVASMTASGGDAMPVFGTSHPAASTPIAGQQMSLPTLAAAIPAAHFAQVWNRNVFSASRVPDVHRDHLAEAPMSGYTLSGVIVSGALRIALLIDPTGKGYSVVVGHVLPHTEWRLRGVDRHAAHFDVDGQDVTLPLRKTPYAMGPSAIPGGPTRHGANGSSGSDGEGNAMSSQQNASNDALGAAQPRADQAQSGTPGLPPLPPGM